MTGLTSTTDDVAARVVGGVGHLLLQRPRGLNALTPAMVDALDDALVAWDDDPAVRRVVLSSADPRAYCSGGDVRALRETAGDPEALEAFFRSEYRLNQRLAELRTPAVAVVDGIAMGGGLGISVHARHRVVTEAARMAMPEVHIGIVPDIGASWFLPRLRGETGWYLGLTGATLTAEDAVWSGLATHLVPRTRLPALLEALLTDVGTPTEQLLDDAAVPTTGGDIASRATDVDAWFGRGLAGALEALATAAPDDELAASALHDLRRAAPAALVATDELLRAGAASTSLAECLAREIGYSVRLTRAPDFSEGVRALLVDRDGAPRWQQGDLPTPGRR